MSNSVYGYGYGYGLNNMYGNYPGTWGQSFPQYGYFNQPVQENKDTWVQKNGKVSYSVADGAADDGKIGTWNACKNIFVGAGKSIASALASPKGWIALAAGVALCAVGGPIATFAAIGFGAMSLCGLGKSCYDYSKAKTDIEAEAALQSIGANGFGVITSLLGFKGAKALSGTKTNFCSSIKNAASRVGESTNTFGWPSLKNVADRCGYNLGILSEHPFYTGFATTSCSYGVGNLTNNAINDEIINRCRYNRVLQNGGPQTLDELESYQRIQQELMYQSYMQQYPQQAAY